MRGFGAFGLSLGWAGGLYLWRTITRRRVGILMLHGVIDDEVTCQWTPLRFHISRKQLEHGLRILSRYFHFVSLDDAVEMLSGRKEVIPNSLALTFDDGYANNLSLAGPILEELGAPATIFLSTAFLSDRRPFWFDRIDFALQRASLDVCEDMNIHVAGRPVRIDAHSRLTLKASYKRIRQIAKAVRREDHDMLVEMEGLADQLEKRSGSSLLDIYERDPLSRVCTWAEARAARGGQFSFGSHTVDHVRLGLVADLDKVRYQVRESKREIEEQLGNPCRFFCYPSGSYDRRALQAVREAGYEAAVTTQGGVNSASTDRYTLRRSGFPSTRSKAVIVATALGFSGFRGLADHFIMGGRDVPECVTGD